MRELKEKDVTKNMVLVNWESPKHKIDTQWGRITYLDFCMREVRRRKSGCELAYIQMKDRRKVGVVVKE